MRRPMQRVSWQPWQRSNMRIAPAVRTAPWLARVRLSYAHMCWSWCCDMSPQKASGWAHTGCINDSLCVVYYFVAQHDEHTGKQLACARSALRWLQYKVHATIKATTKICNKIKTEFGCNSVANNSITAVHGGKRRLCMASCCIQRRITVNGERASRCNAASR